MTLHTTARYKLRSDPRQTTARRIRELLLTYKAAPAQTNSTSVTMPGAEDATVLYFVH